MLGPPCGCENFNFDVKNNVNTQWKSNYDLS